MLKIATFFIALFFSQSCFALSITDTTNGQYNANRRSNLTTQIALDNYTRVQDYSVVAYLPVGTVIAFPSNANFTGLDAHKWLECNGSYFISEDHPELAMLLNAASSRAALPVRTKLPNFEGADDATDAEDIRNRGRFLRGTTDTALVGKTVKDTIRDHMVEVPPHTHTFDGEVTKSTASGQADPQDYMFELSRDGNLTTAKQDLKLDVHATYDLVFIDRGSNKYYQNLIGKDYISRVAQATFSDDTYEWQNGNKSDPGFHPDSKIKRSPVHEGTIGETVETNTRGNFDKKSSKDLYVGRTYGDKFQSSSSGVKRQGSAASATISGSLNSQAVIGEVDATTEQGSAYFSVSGKKNAGSSINTTSYTITGNKSDNMYGYYRNNSSTYNEKSTETAPKHLRVRYFIRAEQ